MNNFKIGVIIDSFQIAVVDSIIMASNVGANGIQIYATDGEMSPENLNASKIREYRSLINANGLMVAALCGDLGGHGFQIQLDNPRKIEKSKRILDLALEFESKVVTTHIGVIPNDNNSEKRKIMQEACQELGEYADQVGAYFAIETGPEPAIVLKSFIDSLDTKGVRVNFDPANFVMVTDEDPVQAVFTLQDYIVHTHAKDGIMIRKIDPEIIYNFFAEGGIGDLRLDQYFREVPLGQGSVNFNAYLDALNSIDYQGFLTIEREVGINPEEDIRQAVRFLGKMAKKFDM